MSSRSPFNPLYATKKQAATILACSEQSIAKMIKNGLPAYYIGRSVRIKICDLENALQSYDPTAPLGNLRKKRRAQ